MKNKKDYNVNVDSLLTAFRKQTKYSKFLNFIDSLSEGELAVMQENGRKMKANKIKTEGGKK